MNNICVVGSMNMDVVLEVENMPAQGETIIAKGMRKVPGGKGANQAVAAKRCGANVYIFSKVGRDEYGENLIQEIKKDGIDTSLVLKDSSEPTGIAIINVDSIGNNSIIVVAGANMTITTKELTNINNIIGGVDILVTQFETPNEVALEGFKMAKNNGKLTVLNPAPARDFDEQLLKYTDIIIPNETEILKLTGIEVDDINSSKIAAEKLIDKGVKVVIITLGAKGAAIITKDYAEVVPAFKVEAIDTTAAGDSFIGGFCSKIQPRDLKYENLKEAVLFANKVSSISVQRKGAQPSIPYLNEIE